MAVAHSAGGAGALNLVRSRGEECQKRLCGIAFTDSVHCVTRSDEDYVKNFIRKRCRNWVKSDEPLDTLIERPKYDCLMVSAGHDKHEYTSGCAINSVFEFLDKRSNKFGENESEDVEKEKGEENEKPKAVKKKRTKEKKKKRRKQRRGKDERGNG